MTYKKNYVTKMAEFEMTTNHFEYIIKKLVLPKYPHLVNVRVASWIEYSIFGESLFEVTFQMNKKVVPGLIESYYISDERFEIVEQVTTLFALIGHSEDSILDVMFEGIDNKKIC